MLSKDGVPTFFQHRKVTRNTITSACPRRSDQWAPKPSPPNKEEMQGSEVAKVQITVACFQNLKQGSSQPASPAPVAASHLFFRAAAQRLAGYNKDLREQKAVENLFCTFASLV